MRATHLSLSILIGFSVIYVLIRSSRAQWFEDPSQTFQNITFDMANRGSYNISICLLDMLQCWEAVKADMVCYRWDWFASICGVTRSLCAELYGDLDGYWGQYNLAQGLCWKNSWQKWT